MFSTVPTSGYRARDHAVQNARACPRTVLVQTWYGTGYETCSMYETVVDCGVAAATNLCPTSTISSATSSSTIPPPIYNPSSQTLSPGSIAGIVIGSVILLTLLILLLARPWRWRKNGPRPSIARSKDGLQLIPRHGPKSSVSIVESGTVQEEPSEGASPPPIPSPLRPIVIERQLLRRPSVHPLDEAARGELERQRYELQRETRSRRRKSALDRYSARNLRQQNRDREIDTTKDNTSQRVTFKSNESFTETSDHGSIHSEAPHEPEMIETRLSPLQNDDDAWSHQATMSDRSGDEPTHLKPQDDPSESSVPESYERLRVPSINDSQISNDHEEPEILRIRHPSLPERKTRQRSRVHHSADPEQSLTGDDGQLRLPGGQLQAEDPVGIRPPPPVAGRRRGWRRSDTREGSVRDV